MNVKKALRTSALIFLSVIIFVLTGCSGYSYALIIAERPKTLSGDGFLQARVDNGLTDDFALGLSDFCYNTMFMTANGTNNTAFSPISLFAALSLLYSGSYGETEAEIKSLLGLEKSVIEDNFSALYNQLNSSKKPYISFQNSVWFSDTHTPDTDTLKTLSQTYYADFFSADFRNKKAQSDANKWVKNNTDKLLDSAGNIDEDISTMLLNILAFSAEWDKEFNKNNNTTEKFYKSDGEEKNAVYMNKSGVHGRVRVEEGLFVSAYLPLKSYGRVYFILPDEDVSCAQILDDPELLQNALNPDERAKVNFKVPKFDFTSTLVLNDGLKSMGLQRAFDPLTAQFKFVRSAEQYVSKISQTARLAVDEKTVSAAAVTKVELKLTSSEPPELIVDLHLTRPFIAVITGTLKTESDYKSFPLFSAVVNNP